MQTSFQPTGPAPAKVMIVGDFPSVLDENKGIPFCDPAGDELGRMLSEAGFFRSACFVTHALRVRPPGNDVDSFLPERKRDITPQHGLWRDRMCLPVVWESAELLKREIELVRPNVIIALGNAAMWMLTGKWGITSWRGSELTCDLDLALDYRPRVIPTYSPASVLKVWNRRPFAVTDLKRARKRMNDREIIRPDYRFIIRPDYATAASVLDQLLHQCSLGPVKLSNDIETRAGHIACIGLAWSDREAICLPLLCVERQEGYWSLEEEAEIQWLLYQLLTHENCHNIGQNFSYDAQYYSEHLHYVPTVARDTMLAAHSMFSDWPKGLDALSSLYCEHHVYWKDDGKEWDERTGEDQLWTYNCEDAVRTFEVDTKEQATIDSLGLRPVFEFQQSLFYPVLRSMLRGLRVDFEERAKITLRLQEEIATREAWITHAVGHELNVGSAKQMQEFFYGALGCREQKNRKTGNLSLDDEALAKIKDQNFLLRPLISKIQELRSLRVFLSTFLLAPVSRDGRMRCSFNIGGTETYRFSSSKNAFGSGLNLQNIPKGGEGEELELPNVRSLFIPDPGMTFFDIDLSSADLRIVVWEADEPEFKAMLREGADPYTEIAKEFYHDPTISKRDPRRQTFKAFAHGTNYLGSAKGLAERLGLSVHEAEKTQKWYFGRFPRIKRWQEDLKDQVVKRRMVQNVFGNRRYYFDRIEGTIFNQAVAWIPQSTVACLINRAYVNIDKHLAGKVEVLLQVHDSLAGQFPTHLGDWAVREIVSQEEIALPYQGDPLTIPVGVKTSTKSWGECG